MSATSGTGGRSSTAKYHANIIACLAFLALAWMPMQLRADWPYIAVSKDGTPIAYEMCGAGEPTLVFVHGWSCDARYWRAQIPHFSKQCRVIILDLAGHGHSGMGRAQYTMAAFGEDVRAVVEAAGAGKVILIGHSMGGVVIAEAARLMPGQVMGLIGVDTLVNIEYPLTHAEMQKMIEPLEQDFRTGSQKFVAEMMRPQADPRLREWILADMSAAPPAIALSAIKEMMTLYVTGEVAKVFEQIRVPVLAVNADLWPVNFEANRRHMLSFDAIILKAADHFLMMNRPEEFNRALEKVIRMLPTDGPPAVMP